MLTVLDQGDGWVVVAKPPRMLVHRNARDPKADAALQRVRNQMGCRVYPIHRLDRPASGCLLFATRQSMAGPLHQALSVAHKQYVVLVRGAYRGPDPVEVTNPMKDDNGILKDAVTTVRCLGASAEPRCSILMAEPSTGRYHQVRRHVRDLNHPVVGDREHGDSRINRWWRETLGHNRLGLHCLRMVLVDPGGGTIDVTCPLFEDLYAVWSQLPFWEAACTLVPELGVTPLPLVANQASVECTE